MHLGAPGDLLYGTGAYPPFIAAGKTAISAEIICYEEVLYHRTSLLIRRMIVATVYPQN